VPRILPAIAAVLLLTAAPAAAQVCKIRGPRPLMTHDMVQWTLTLKRDTTCLHGVRSASLILDRVLLATPPKFGFAQVEAYGLTYRPNPGFTGEDSLSLVFLGSTAKSRGTSTIEIRISVE
jgi:hypothetical protein